MLEGLQPIICLLIPGSVADPDGGHASGLCRVDPSIGVLHDRAVFRCFPKKLGRFEKDLRIRLGMADVGAVRDRIEHVEQLHTLQNELGVLAGRSDGELIAPPFEFRERFVDLMQYFVKQTDTFSFGTDPVSNNMYYAVSDFAHSDWSMPYSLDNIMEVFFK